MYLSELTEGEWDAIEQHIIDDSIEDAITLLLVLDGVKPGSKFIIRRDEDSNKSVGDFLEEQKETHNLLSIITNHNIPYIARVEIQENLEVHNEPRINVFYSLDETSFHLLYTPTNEPPSTGEGKFFGFPEKSVKAFEEGTHVKANTPQQRRFIYRFKQEYFIDPEELAFLEVAHLAPAPETQSIYEKWELGKEYINALLDISQRFEKEFIRELVEYILIDNFEERVLNGKYGVFEVEYSVQNYKGSKTTNTEYIPAITEEKAKSIVSNNEREFILQTYMSPDTAEIQTVESSFCSRTFPYSKKFVTEQLGITIDVPTITIDELREDTES